MKDQSARDILRISNEQRAAILNSLDEQKESGEITERREYSRLSYRVPDGLLVEIAQPSGPMARFLVAPRNISRGGIAFLHGSFIYPGTVCAVTLENVDKKLVRVPGRVVDCRHVGGRVHEVSVKFLRLIDLGNYSLGDRTAGASGNGGQEAGADAPIRSRSVSYDDIGRLATELADLATSKQPFGQLRGKFSELADAFF